MTDDQVNTLLDRLDRLATILDQVFSSMQPSSQANVVAQTPVQTQDEFATLSKRVSVEQWKQQFGEDKVLQWMREGESTLGV